MPPWIDHLPTWVPPALYAVATIAGSYLLGRILKELVAGWLVRMASGAHGQWNDILVGELRTHVPLWSLLLGLRISLNYWPIPDKWLHLASTGISVMLFASITLALGGIAAKLVGAYGARAVPGVPISNLTRNVVRLVVIAGGLLVVLNELGIEIRPMLAALGVGGLAVALALQEPLANLFAGLFVSLAGQVRIGDHVKLDSGVEGRIVDFNWRSTWLEVPGGSVAVVPNSKLSQSIVTNFNLPNPELAIPIQFTIRFEEDPVKAERTALEVARAVMRDTPGAAPKFEPTVRFHTFGDLGLKGTVTLRASTWGDQVLIRHRFVVAMHDRFRADGIELVSTAPPRPAAPQAPPTAPPS
ncbi:MAG TPA: mechanosensitive ion channel family protein [Vicinamibacterales bacterium]|jgi:small-conductance mechanosensitive channel|nr:mechanosensitive ion channel family protein [Vicinamibacterales bacterium]